MIDLLALAALSLFGVFGAWRGALESGARLLGLVVGYAAALRAATVSGPRLAESLGLAPWLGPVAAATGAFIACQLLVGVAIFGLRRFEAKRFADRVRSGVDRAIGASLGVLRGSAVVLLVGWLLLFVDALRVTGVAEDLPDLSGARLPQLAGRAAGGAVRAALGDDDPTARVASRLAERPGGTAEALRGVLEHPRFLALQADTRFWQAVQDGRIDAALARPSLWHLTQDSGLRGELAALGLVEETLADSPRALHDAIGEGLRAAAPRLRRLRDDPELGALLADPEVRRLLEAGDAAALLARPDFRALVSRVLDEQAA